MEKNDFKHYGKISGTVLIIGYGSIGKGILPLIKRHFSYDKLIIIDPVEDGPKDHQIQFWKMGLSEENCTKTLDKVFGQNGGFCVNLSVETSSKQITLFCQQRKILYIDAAVEDWQDWDSFEKLHISERSNYAMRQDLLEAVRENPHKSTAVSCCGANPGMVSWFVKQALINLAKDTDFKLQKQPETQEEWAKLMKDLGIKGIHIAQRDTQYCKGEKKADQFWNTWSIDGFIAQAVYQPAELGWGTHQKWRPKGAMDFDYGCKSSIYLNQPGIATQVKTWCPTYGPQLGFLVTHNEALSLSDYFTVKEDNKVVYRPTVHYAYHPCESAITSALECIGKGKMQEKWKVLNQQDIEDGIDELGVLLFGHAKNAYWYGSQLSHTDTKKLISTQNATGLQVSSAVLAGMVWALENPNEGVVEAEQMDYKRCLEIQKPYIQPVNGFYTKWTPLENKLTDFSGDGYDEQDPWQFKNILMGPK